MFEIFQFKRKICIYHIFFLMYFNWMYFLSYLEKIQMWFDFEKHDKKNLIESAFDKSISQRDII